MLASEILDYYGQGKEEGRLTAAVGRLEQLRTWEIIERHLPPAPSRVLDVGGGTGVYALPLAGRGYQVHLVDPVPLHVERARALSRSAHAPLASAEVGDARRLHAADAAFDVVLLFGPLYHLIDRRDRVTALAEARRVLVPGGLLLSAHISRFASACEIGLEIEEAGLTFDKLLAVEGPGWMNQDLDPWLDNVAERERLFQVLRRLETEPTLIGMSAHVLAVAHR